MGPIGIGTKLGWYGARFESIGQGLSLVDPYDVVRLAM